MIHQMGLDLIKQEETFSAAAYEDDVGVWTIGYGHTGSVDGVPVKDLASITEYEAEALLALDIGWAESTVDDMVAVELSELQRAALVSFVFNLGSGAFRGSTLLKLLNRGDYARAAWEFRKWRIGDGKILPGLLTRRGREEQLFRWSEA